MPKFGPYEPHFSSAMRDLDTGKWQQFFDPTDEMANRYGFYMQIYAIKSKAQLSFKAFLENFADNYEMKTEQKQYVNSQNIEIKQSGIVRKLDISLAIPSANVLQAKFHMQNLNLLVQSLYSTANEKGMASSVGAPKFRIRLLNLMADPNKKIGGLETSASALSTGLTGFIDGLGYEFDLDAGFMTDPQDLGFVYPKLIKLSFTYYPQTKVNPIWKTDGSFNLKSYPYAYKGMSDVGLGSSATGATTLDISKQNKTRIDKLLGNT